MASASRYIAIDIGSSYIKSAVLDPSGVGLLVQDKLPAIPKIVHTDPHLFELPAQAIVDKVRRIIDGYAAAYPGIGGVLLSTQMHGFVYSCGGEDVYVSWQDTRCLKPMDSGGTSYLDYLKTLLSPIDMAHCGVYLKPSLGLCNLYALLPERPADGVLYTLGSYILAALTGNNVCHISNAAPLGLADARTGQWDRTILEKLGFGDMTLPRIAASDFEVCGVYRCPINGQDIALYPDFGDQQAAILGCMAGDRDVVVNIATAAQLAQITDSFMPGPYEIRPYFEGKYLNVISNMPGGRNLDVLIGFLGDTAQLLCGERPSTAQIWQQVLRDFTGDSGELGVDMRFYDTPGHLRGGAITGIMPENFSVQTLFAAAFADIAATYDRTVGTLCDGKSAPERLVFSGGVSWKTPQLLHTVSQQAGLPYTLSAFPDEVLAGLYRTALVCVGVCAHLDDKPELQLEYRKEPVT